MLLTLPIVRIGENTDADYLKYSYFFNSTRDTEGDVTKRLAACERVVNRMKKSGTIVKITVDHKDKQNGN